MESAVDKRMTRTPALFDNADVLAEAVVREVGTNIERLFGAYPELAYANALRERRLPPNIEVSEFFFLAGRWLSVPVARQN